MLYNKIIGEKASKQSFLINRELIMQASLPVLIISNNMLGFTALVLMAEAVWEW